MQLARVEARNDEIDESPVPDPTNKDEPVDDDLGAD
jgi:hypothetical protein